MAYDIRKVKTMTDLIGYFSQNLRWNIDVDDFDDIEDISYDFEAEDIGLKEEAFAKISSLRQLQPLVDGQRWGIFCVEFDSDKFEVTALRKILSGLVPKRRNSADHAVWDQKDLMFICNWGKDNNRTIGIAHFEDKDSGLPQIKMISCAPAMEDFTQIKVFEDRLAQLAFPRNTRDIDAWRESWASAFVSGYRQAIHDATTLTIQLAAEAVNIKKIILDIFEVESPNGYVHLLYEKFRNTLIHDMTKEQFADMYAQTVVYGLFSARCMDKTQGNFSAEEAIDCIPNTNPFLKSLMKECLGSENNTKLSFDELEISNVVELLRNTRIEAIIQDFNRQTGGGREDPVIHFYEEFLTAYDKAQKVQRGVYYTPQPVVNFMVRAVDSIIKEQFGLRDGLASEETKKIKVKRKSYKKRAGQGYKEVEELVDVPAIQVLDPATGTGTFLRQTILQIYENFKAKHKGLRPDQLAAEWNKYVPEQLLPRLNGFELMMAPYAVAHMKLAMVLKDTGYDFSADSRLKVYLTNSLEEPGSSDEQMSFFDDPLAIESIEANGVKKNSGINIVLGNPPYSSSSSNRGDWILSLLQEYKEGLNERKINLDDDYIKFIRYGQNIVSQSGSGVLAYISNNSFLDGMTHRRMRYELMRTFDEIIIINLHGNSKRFETTADGGKDENVFDIQQGVSINIFVKNGAMSKTKGSALAKVLYSDLFGFRYDKYSKLVEFEKLFKSLAPIEPIAPYYFFVPKNFEDNEEYSQGFAIDELMPIYTSGIQTKNDYLAIHFHKSETDQVQHDFISLSEAEITAKYNLKDSAGWKIRNAVNDIKTNPSSVEKIMYRPFDWRYILYSGNSSGFLGRPREKVSRHFVGHRNLGLLVRKNTPPVDFTHAYITDSLISEGVLGIDPNGREYVFPLYLYSDEYKQPDTNLNTEIMEKFGKILGKNAFTAEDVVAYIYAILYSSKYRKKYSEFLKINFPRIPYPTNLGYFNKLAELGKSLIKLHLVDFQCSECDVSFLGDGSNIVSKLKHDANRVYINKTQYFYPVDTIEWNQLLGGYAPLQKWMKLRKDCVLTQEEIECYIKAAYAMRKTREIMQEIDSFTSF